MASSACGAGRDGPGDRTEFGLEGVLRQLPVGVVVAEAPSGRVVHLNARVEEIWRRSFGEISGVADYGVWNAVHADGHPLAPEEWPLARALREGEVTEARLIEIVRGDGSRGVVRVSANPVREGERIVGAVLTCSDATEQSRREEIRRVLAETSRVLATSLDYERTLRNVTRLVVPALADWCSIDMAGEEDGLERLVVAHADPDAPGEVSELPRRPVPLDGDRGIARVLRTGAAELAGEVDEELLRALVPNEEQRRFLAAREPHSAMIVPLLARGRILGAIVLVAAGARRRYVAEDLELAQELAARAALAIDNARLYHESQGANRAKADFLAVISHELRTPLTAIIGYAELLALGVPEPVTDRQREQVERIEVAARHLLQLIEEILTMSSLDSGHARVRSEQVDVRELLRRAQIISQPLASAKGLTLRVDPVEDGLEIRSDADRLLQILLSLLSNAVKFTESGEVRLSARRVGEEVEFRVRDTGIGVEPQNRERIFDAFWQAEQPITRRVGGTGLGLAISRRLMDLLGGEIDVESTPGEGSTFILRVAGRASEGEGASEG